MNNDCCIKSIAVSNVSDCAVQGLRLRGTKKREDNRTENVCLARHSYFLCVVFNGHDDDDVIFMCVCVVCVCVGYFLFGCVVYRTIKTWTMWCPRSIRVILSSIIVRSFAFVRFAGSSRKLE